MQRTKIEWATHTWSPIVGCSKVSAGCANCYAEAMVNRFPWMTGVAIDRVYDYSGAMDDHIVPNGWDGRAHFFPERLEEPFRLRHGKDRTHRIFVCSMSDLFHESLSNEQIAAVFGVMAATPQHQYVVITKRLQRALEWFEYIAQCGRVLPFMIGEEIPDGASGEAAACVMANTVDPVLKPIEPVAFCTGVKQPWPLPNVIMGVSVEDFRFHPRVDSLRRIPAARRLISFEPMLGPITANLDGIDLAICGAETGPGKRPFRDEWALDLRDQCKTAGTTYFFKKDGAGKPTLQGVEYHEWIGEVA